jgi:hypothetical protein
LPPDKTRGSAALFAWMFVVLIGGQAVLVALDRWVYVATPRTVAVLLLIAVVTWALNRAASWRARSLES